MRRVSVIVGILLLLMGLGLFLAPDVYNLYFTQRTWQTISEFRAERGFSGDESDFSEAGSKAETDENLALLEQYRAYNAEIYVDKQSGLTDAWSYEQSPFAGGESLFGTIEIPAIPQEAFDEVLRLGGNERNSVQRILANHQLGNADFANYLKNEFLASGHEGGRGIVLGREPYAVWFEQEGIRIARGNTVRSVDSVLFTWQEAAAEIDDLIHAGVFAPAEAIDDAIPYMRLEAAQSIWYLHQDLAQDATFFLSEEYFSGKGFPDSTQMIADLLDDPLYLAQALQGLRMFAAEYRDNPDLLRFHIAAHSPERIRQRLDLLQNEPTFYPSVIREHETPAFIQRGRHLQGGELPPWMVSAVCRRCGQLRSQPKNSGAENKGPTGAGRSSGVLPR